MQRHSAADKWSYASGMNIKRWGHSACIMRGRIYVAGGDNAETEPLDEKDCYDLPTSRWKIVARTNDKVVSYALVAF